MPELGVLLIFCSYIINYRSTKYKDAKGHGFSAGVRTRKSSAPKNRFFNILQFCSQFLPEKCCEAVIILLICLWIFSLLSRFSMRNDFCHRLYRYCCDFLRIVCSRVDINITTQQYDPLFRNFYYIKLRFWKYRHTFYIIDNNIYGYVTFLYLPLPSLYWYKNINLILWIENWKIDSITCEVITRKYSIKVKMCEMEIKHGGHAKALRQSCKYNW